MRCLIVVLSVIGAGYACGLLYLALTPRALEASTTPPTRQQLCSPMRHAADILPRAHELFQRANGTRLYEPAAAIVAACARAWLTLGAPCADLATAMRAARATRVQFYMHIAPLACTPKTQNDADDAELHSWFMEAAVDVINALIDVYDAPLPEWFDDGDGDERFGYEHWLVDDALAACATLLLRNFNDGACLDGGGGDMAAVDAAVADVLSTALAAELRAAFNSSDQTLSTMFHMPFGGDASADSAYNVSATLDANCAYDEDCRCRCRPRFLVQISW
jgi:hypothetical protein